MQIELSEKLIEESQEKEKLEKRRKQIDIQECVLCHYSFSISEKDLTAVQRLVKILEYILTELQHLLRNPSFKYNGTTVLSQVVLLVAEGDSKEAKNIHKSLCLGQKK